MAISPEVQKKVQKELDSLNGDQRLPDFTDFEDLPCLAAVVNEVFRWHRSLHSLFITFRLKMMLTMAIISPRALSWFQMHTPWCATKPFLAHGKKAPDFSDVDTTFGFGRCACPRRCECSTRNDLDSWPPCYVQSSLAIPFAFWQRQSCRRTKFQTPTTWVERIWREVKSY